MSLMKSYKLLFVLLIMLFFSCNKDYTQREKYRIEELTANHIYKHKVSDDAFVFCLDTIKSDNEYVELEEEYCRRGEGKTAYLFLSSYNTYLQVLPQYLCDDTIWSCWRIRNDLGLIVNPDGRWLVDDELVMKLCQSKLDSLTSNYYNNLKLKNRLKYALINFNVKAIKDNSKRDSLYVSLLHSYYSLIKKEKVKSGLLIDSLQKVYPFNLAIGKRTILPPQFYREVD